MSEPRQQFAAVCGNFHILRDDLDYVVEPGTPPVPRMCPSCSAPVFTRCTNEGCNEPVFGDKDYNVVVLGGKKRADWFCHACGKPYLWAKPDQVRTWVENRLKFDSSLDVDDQLELIEMLAVLTPEEPPAERQDFNRFRELLKRAPAVYEEIKPFLPVLLELFKR